MDSKSFMDSIVKFIMLEFVTKIILLIGLAFQLTGILVPLAGIINLIGHLNGRDFKLISLGDYKPEPWIGFVLAIITGIITWLIGKLILNFNRKLIERYR